MAVVAVHDARLLVKELEVGREVLRPPRGGGRDHCRQAPRKPTVRTPLCLSPGKTLRSLRKPYCHEVSIPFALLFLFPAECNLYTPFTYTKHSHITCFLFLDPILFCRITLSNDKFRVIKCPTVSQMAAVGVLSLGKSENGVYSGVP